MRLAHPCPGARISQYFGENPNHPVYGYGPRGHLGLDFGVVVGTPLAAPESGRVIVGNAPDDYGLYVLIEVTPTRVWLLAHLSDVKRMDIAAGGCAVALSGNSGNSTAPHVHVGLKVDGEWVDPLPYLEGNMTNPASKLGVHFQTKPELGGAGTEAIRNSKIPWVKGINTHEWDAGLFPNQRILDREWIGGDHVEAAYYRRGSAGARDYFDALRPQYDKLKARGILDVEGPNEPQATCGYDENPEQYAYDWGVIAEFFYEWARLVVAYGMRPWVFSISVGQPHQAVWPLLLNATKAASTAGGGMCVHEYGAPSVMSGDGWWTLRLKRMLDAWGDPDVRIIVGECGIDGGVLDANHARWGWLKFARAGWVYAGDDAMDLGDAQGHTIMTEELYWRQMRWYDQELCKIPQVVAATPFVHNPESTWESFNWPTALIERTAALYENVGLPVSDLEQRIVEIAHQVVMPLNSVAALAKAGIAKGYALASDEFIVDGHVAQCFRKPGDDSTIYTAYCPINVWTPIKWIEHAN